MSFFHGKVELKSTRNCFISLPSKWNLAHFQANQYGIIVVKVIFLDDIKCDKYIYGTWNGARSHHEDNVVFDRLYAASLGVQSGDEILVQAVKGQLTECIECHLTPVAENDYQLIQLNANEIELELLHQLRVITTAFIKDELNHFCIFPIWVTSSPNIPMYVRISHVEPFDKNGLILTDSTKLVIHSLSEKVTVPTLLDIKRMKTDENSPNTLKSVFGLFRSMLPKSQLSDAVPQCPEINIASQIEHEVPLYRGKPLMLRVIPSHSIDSRLYSLKYCTVFISNKHFENLVKYSINKKYCLFRMKKLLTSGEKHEPKISPANLGDFSALSYEEKFNLMFVEKLLTTFDTRNEFLVIAFAVENLPMDSIVVNEWLRKQHTITATSYAYLQEIEIKHSGLPIAWRDGIARLTIPMLTQMTLFPLTLDQSDVPDELVLKHELNLLMPFAENIMKNAIFISNGFILTLGKHYFIACNKVNVNIDKLDFSKLLLSSFYAFSNDTKLVVKQTPIKCDISHLLLKLTQDSKSLDNTHLQVSETTLLNPFVVLDALYEKCVNFVKISLQLNIIPNDPNYSSVTYIDDLHSSMLIIGSKGSGKTSLVKRIEHYLIKNHHVFFQIIQCSRLKGKRIESLHKSWCGIFEEAMQRQPSLLVFEGLDELAYDVPDEKQASNELDATGNTSLENIYCSRAAYVFCNLVDSLRKFKLSSPQHSRVAIIATTNSSLHSLISQLCPFDEVIELQSPDSRQRALILQEMVTKKGLSLIDQSQLDVSIQFNLKLLARLTKGFMLKELNNLIDLAVHKALVRTLENQNMEGNFSVHSLSITDQDVEFALSQHSSKQIQKLNSTLRLTDVGGMDNVKEIVLNTVLLPTRFSRIFSHLPLKSQNSILLYGMPGTGKTMLIEAVANESGLNFIGVKGPELLSKYIGASEQAVRHLFERAQSVAPCILFFDEFDSLAPRRGHDSTGVTDRIVNQMLTLLDGLETMRRDVYVLAATSRPDLIDLALLRPGRFDHCVLCPLPTESNRGEILISLARKLTIDIDSFPFNQVVQSTANFSGADLQALIYNAYLSATKRTVMSQLEDGGGEVTSPQNKITLEWGDIEMALRTTRPSLDDRERDRFASIYDKFEAELSGRVTATSQPKTLTLA